MVRVLALVILFSPLAVPAADAQVFLELVGQTQGAIPGNATFAGEENRIEVTSFSEGAFNLVDPVSGTSISRGRQSVSITKLWDPSSIKLLRAQGEAEQFTTCVFRFYRDPGTGTVSFDRRMPMTHLTVELTGARVEHYTASGIAGDLGATENVSVSYDAIRYTYTSTGETFIDTIRGPGAARTTTHRAPGPLEPSGSDFEFVLPGDGQVGIDIADSDGHWVTTLFDDDAVASGGVVRWDATDASGQKVPAGVYTAKVRTSGAEITRRMVVGG